MMANRGWIFLALCMAAPPGAATAAEVYRWVDDTGRVHYSDEYPDGAAARNIRTLAIGESAQRPELSIVPSAPLDEAPIEAERQAARAAIGGAAGSARPAIDATTSQAPPAPPAPPLVSPVPPAAPPPPAGAPAPPLTPGSSVF